MASIKSSSIRDLKLRVNLVDVVSRVVTLRKAGGVQLKGLCPFHNEKTPSFQVNPDKGLYHCFGCNKSGDVIKFVQETEQLSFVEAIETLGQRFGVVIEYEEGSGPSREERSLRHEIFELHDHAAEHFHRAFKAQEPAGDFMRAYWQEKRRFSLDLADEFKIGVADANGSGLGAALLKRNYSEAALRECGLFFIYDNAAITLHALRPRFRGRLMIPIRDHQGRVVAFTARQTELTPADDPAREAKYVNSPETPIFTKGNLLFNLDRARSAVGEGKPFVMVEGQLDALRCWSVGLKTAIAPQGTAITESQLVLLRRYHTEVECFFDSDSAGQKASLRFLPMALKAGLEVRFLTLEGADKIDPDLLFLEQGIGAYAALRRGALSAMAFACKAALPSPETASAEQKTRASVTLFELAVTTESEVARSQFLAEAAGHLRLPLAAMQRDFALFRQRGGKLANASQTPAKPGGDATASPAANTSEFHLLILCLHFERIGRSLSRTLPHDWIDGTRPDGVLLNRFLSEFEHGTWPGSNHLDPLLETSEERTLVASLLFKPPIIDDPVKVANEGLRQLRSRALEPRLRQIELDLANHHADSKSDPISLLRERTELQRQLRQPLGLVADL
jgi:DNA primase